MRTQRFEGANLEEAVEAARDKVGPSARIVGASRVRRGGVGGFFAREHVEVEVQVEPRPTGPAPAAADATNGTDASGSTTVGPGPGPTLVEPAAGGDGRRSAAHAPGPGPAPKRGRMPFRRPPPISHEPPIADEDEQSDELVGAGDPMTELIEEMAQNGPSSVLDLAEVINAEQSRFSLADDRNGRSAATRATVAPAAAAKRPVVAPEPARSSKAPAPTPAPRPQSTGAQSAGTRSAGTQSAGTQAARTSAPGTPPAFAAVLARIARQEGLVAPENADDIIPEPPTWQTVPGPGPSAGHSDAILADLGAHGDVGERTSGPAPTASSVAGPSPTPPAAGPLVPRAEHHPAPVSKPQVSELELALLGLGLPAGACPALLSTMSVTVKPEAVEAELRRALELALPPLPPMPRSPTSVVAVVGPRGQVLETARALAADLGAPPEEVALATQRNVWRQQDRLISSPEAAIEERRSWRWRGHPTVVAIEASVRPNDDGWARTMLEALEPTLCWGVAEASRKPEDISAWSVALGGLDVVALVDLDGTTTPAAALAGSVPVGRLDGQPATPAAWARALCARLTAS